MEVYLAQIRRRITETKRVPWWSRLLTEFIPQHAYALGGVAVAVLVLGVFAYVGGRQTMNVAMPGQRTFIDYLETPDEQVSAVTYTNAHTQTTVVWLCGAEVKASTSEGPS